METEILEGDELAQHIDALGSDMIRLRMEGRFYRNVQNKQNVAVITARLGDYIGVGFSAKAAVDPDLGDDATVLLAVGRAFEDLGSQITQYLHDAIEGRLAHIRGVERMQAAVAQMQENEGCPLPITVVELPADSDGNPLAEEPTDGPYRPRL